MATHAQQKPREILKNISHRQSTQRVHILGIPFTVFPSVFPSHEFRTTKFLLKSILPLLPGKVVCDMGCGFGVVGAYALRHGAKNVTSADINKTAVANAKSNYKDLGLTKRSFVQESNCFTNLPQQHFDLIVFNPPFNGRKSPTEHALAPALYDPGLKTMHRFLKQAPAYMKPDTHIVIAYSNRGDIDELERLFLQFGYHWKLWRRKNTKTWPDNRLYLLTQ